LEDFFLALLGRWPAPPVADMGQAGGARLVQSRLPICHLKGFGDSSIDFLLRFWINDPQNGVTNIKGLVYLALWDKFKEHDIDIPFPHRRLLIQNLDAQT